MTRKRRMFYSTQLLSNKSKTIFSKIYFISSTKRKLSKKEMENIDLNITIQNIVEPPVPFSLRLYSLLLRGIVRIYILKVKNIESELKIFLNSLCIGKRKRSVDLKIMSENEANLDRIFKKFYKSFKTNSKELKNKEIENPLYFQDENYNMEYFNNELDYSELDYRGSSGLNNSTMGSSFLNNSIQKNNVSNIYSNLSSIKLEEDSKIDLDDNEGYLTKIIIGSPKKQLKTKEKLFYDVERLFNDSNNLSNLEIKYQEEYNETISNPVDTNTLSNIIESSEKYEDIETMDFNQVDNFNIAVNNYSRFFKVINFYKLLCLCNTDKISATQSEFMSDIIIKNKL